MLPVPVGFRGASAVTEPLQFSSQVGMRDINKQETLMSLKQISSP